MCNNLFLSCKTYFIQFFHHFVKTFQACDLFLRNRSAIIKYNIRQLKFEGATSLYIRRLCGVFFPSLMETGREFVKAFQDHYGCMSGIPILNLLVLILAHLKSDGMLN